MRKQDWKLSPAARQAFGAQALQNLNRQVTKPSGDFHSNASENGDQKLWDECQREEQEAAERALAPIKHAEQELNKTFIAAQANELLTLPNDPFLAENCKQTDKPNTDEGIRNAFLAFRGVMLPAVITDAGIELLGRVTELNPRVDWSSTSPLTFHAAWTRLESLGLVTEGTHITSNIVHQPQTQEPQALLDARDAAEAQWLSLFRETWDAWLLSMVQGWNFHPTQEQKRSALELLMKLGTGNGIWDECRRRLVSSGVFPSNLRTIDDILTERIEAGVFGDLNTPAGKAAYARERTQLLHGNPVEV